MSAEIPLDLQESLKSVMKENIQQYSIELVVNEKGQGFISEVIFVTLTHKITHKKIEMVVKQEKKGSEEVAEDLTLLFQNEINFYQSIWPFLKEYYKTATGKDLCMVPKCLGTWEVRGRQIILENINSQGYALYEKTKPFDDEHIRKIMETYGIYHGISMALREKDIDIYNQLVNQQTNMFKKAFEDESSQYCKLFVNSITEILQFFDSKKEKHMLDKLLTYVESGPKILKQVVNEEFPKGVILHGDSWSNNMMFRYNDQGHLEDMKLLDFQILCHGTPIFDLSYCLYSGASATLLSRLDEYLSIYHSSLSVTLKAFDLYAQEIYSLNTLKEEWHRYSKIGFMTGVHIWKLKLVDMNNVPDFTQRMDVSFCVSKNNEEYYKQIIRDLCFHMYDKDFF